MPILVNLPGPCAAFVRGLNFVGTAADAARRKSAPAQPRGGNLVALRTIGGGRGAHVSRRILGLHVGHAGGEKAIALEGREKPWGSGGSRPFADRQPFGIVSAGGLVGSALSLFDPDRPLASVYRQP